MLCLGPGQIYKYFTTLTFCHCQPSPHHWLLHLPTGYTKAIQIIHFWRFCLSATFRFCCLLLLQFAFFLRLFLLLLPAYLNGSKVTSAPLHLHYHHFVLCFRRVARCAAGQWHLHAKWPHTPIKCAPTVRRGGCREGAASLGLSTLT